MVRCVTLGGNLQLELLLDPGQGPQMWRQNDADHLKFCTSTERTDGRSRTIVSHVSPLSEEQYT